MNTYSVVFVFFINIKVILLLLEMSTVSSLRHNVFCLNLNNQQFNDFSSDFIEVLEFMATASML